MSDCLICGNQDMEFEILRATVVKFILSNDLSGLRFAIVLDCSNVRRPLRELSYPVGNGGVGNNDENWEDVLLNKHADECGDLYGFALETIEFKVEKNIGSMKRKRTKPISSASIPVCLLYHPRYNHVTPSSCILRSECKIRNACLVYSPGMALTCPLVQIQGP